MCEKNPRDLFISKLEILSCCDVVRRINDTAKAYKYLYTVRNIKQ